MGKKSSEIRVKISKKALARGVTILLFAGCLATIIAQFIHIRNLSTEIKDTAWRLGNYRELQKRQIQNVKFTCNRLKNKTDDTNSLINQIGRLVKYVAPELETDYKTEIFSLCYAPLFIVADVLDTKIEDPDDLVLEENSNFNIRNDAFDRVRW